MRQLRSLALLLLLAVILPCAHAQKNPGAPSRPTLSLGAPSNAPFALGGIGTPPTPTSAEVRQVTLGNATVPLTGPWKFHTADNPEWAQPGFDDSAWGTMDLTPVKSTDPHYGTGDYVPGWTARGYRGYHGYAWYRLKINIEDNALDQRANNNALAFKMPWDVDDAYQVYVNGHLAGEFGDFSRRWPVSYRSQPRAFLLPASLRSGAVTIAVRFWMDPDSVLIDPNAGGMHGPPVLGRTATTRALLRLDWNAVDRSQASSFLEMAVLLLALALAFGLFWLDRNELAYLWLGLTCAALLVYAVMLTAGYYVPWIGELVYLSFEEAILIPVSLGLWVLFWAYWFRLDRMARLHWAVWGLVLPLATVMAMLRAPVYGGVVPVHAVVWLSPLRLLLKLLIGALLVWVTVRGIRKNRAEGWLALPAVLLVAISQYQGEMFALHVPVYFFPIGFGINLNQIATMLSLAIITVLLLRRFLRGQREREQWKLEIEQARQLQQVLIPEALPVIPGFTIESEYRPAQRVGGDFFQVIRHPADGSVLIVVGDVTGHGLTAAMMVSLLVGAIRDRAETGYEPLALLQALNRRLRGRGNLYATCLALRIQPDGAIDLANAGHLPPYLNGKELPMEGALPLGMIDNAEFSEMRFQLAPGDTLLLMTDGLAEAQDAQGGMFGFERIARLAQQSLSAAEIAAAAQTFGQQDDITVLRIVRDGVIAPANLQAIDEVVIAG